jgi:hypothetical protein
LKNVNLIFGECGEVRLFEVKNINPKTDFSMLSSVGLSACNLEGVDLKFREGAKVDLTKAKGKLPDPVEFDM